MNETLKKYLICAGAGLAAVLAAAAAGGIFKSESAVDTMRILSDGFFTAGALLMGVGGLIWTGNKGGGDGLGFAARSVFGTKFSKKEEPESFSDYRERKHKKDKSPRIILICGAAFILIALAFLGIYELIC